MDFLTYFAASILVVWVFFAWNDLGVLSKRLRRVTAVIEDLQQQRITAARDLIDAAPGLGDDVASRLRAALDAAQAGEGSAQVDAALVDVLTLNDVSAAAELKRLQEIERQLAELRHKAASVRAHYDRVYASFPASVLAPLLGHAADPVKGVRSKQPARPANAAS